MYRSHVESQYVSSSSVPLSPTGERFIPHLSQTPVSVVGSLVRSQSNPSLKRVNEDPQGGNEFSFFQSVGLGERTPITHFSTPCCIGSGNLPSDDNSKTKLISQKQLSDQHHRIPLRHFYSEVNLHKVSATPDCFKKVHVESRKNKGEPEDLSVLLGEEMSNLTVGVRVRPLIMREQNDASVVNVVSVNGNEVKVVCESGMAYTFTYDYCFWSCDSEHPRFASQDMVFTTMVQPLIDRAFLGYNACLFAYGQTGSGKSYRFVYILT
jgi:Kinesin-like protein